jgi:hypothetical protein
MVYNAACSNGNFSRVKINDMDGNDCRVVSESGSIDTTSKRNTLQVVFNVNDESCNEALIAGIFSLISFYD